MHDSTVVQSAIAEVTYVPTVLPAELNAVWEANYQSASTEYNLDNQTWYHGSKDKAMQVLGNINNTISLRTIDPETQEFEGVQFHFDRYERVG